VAGWNMGFCASSVTAAGTNITAGPAWHCSIGCRRHLLDGRRRDLLQRFRAHRGRWKPRMRTL
jgi:hypothetical protein